MLNLVSKGEAREKRSKLIAWAMAVLASGAFIDALYLFLKRVYGAPVKCLAFGGCDTVAQSVYSQLFGVPLALLGALFYGVFILIVAAYLQRETHARLNAMVWGALFAGGFSAYLVALQAFVIGAWCFYCVITDTIGILLAMLATALIRLKRK